MKYSQHCPETGAITVCIMGLSALSWQSKSKHYLILQLQSFSPSQFPSWTSWSPSRGRSVSPQWVSYSPPSWRSVTVTPRRKWLLFSWLRTWVWSSLESSLVFCAHTNARLAFGNSKKLTREDSCCCGWAHQFDSLGLVNILWIYVYKESEKILKKKQKLSIWYFFPLLLLNHAFWTLE